MLNEQMGMTILLTTQYLEEADALADDVAGSATTDRAAWAKGSYTHDVVEPADKLRLTTRML